MRPEQQLAAWGVSRETFERLSAYVAFLTKWQKTIQLVSPKSLQEIWDRHILDSAQLATLIPPSVTTLADMGAGGGLPGLVLALLRPELRVTLIEQDRRKAAFLIEAIRVLDIKHAKVFAGDIADCTEQFECVTARALAPLSALLAYAYPLIHTHAICFFPKGESYATELEEAKGRWQFNSQLHPSKTQKQSAIVSITELSLRAS